MKKEILNSIKIIIIAIAVLTIVAIMPLGVIPLAIIIILMSQNFKEMIKDFFSMFKWN